MYVLWLEATEIWRITKRSEIAVDPVEHVCLKHSFLVYRFCGQRKIKNNQWSKIAI